MEKNLHLNLIFFICSLSICLTSCKKETHFIKSYYYPTGELLSETPYSLKDSLKDGSYKEYFKNGTIKKIINFKKGENIDSSMAYYDSGELRFTENRTDDTLFAKYFHKDGSLAVTNKFLNVEPPIQIAWSYVFKNNGRITDSLEFLNINGKSHQNQRYSYSDDGTIQKDSSHYYQFKISKIKETENYKLEVKYEPFVEDAQVFLVIGKEFNSDFSNIKNVKSDTLFMENNKISSNTLDKPFRNIKGFFFEYSAWVIDSTTLKDSVRMRISEVNTYFDRRIVVSDTIQD